MNKIFDRLEDEGYNFCYSRVNRVYEIRVWKFRHPIMKTDTRKRIVATGSGLSWQEAFENLDKAIIEKFPE